MSMKEIIRCLIIGYLLTKFGFWPYYLNLHDSGIFFDNYAGNLFAQIEQNQAIT